MPTLLDSWLRRGILTSSVIRPEKQLDKLWGEAVSKCFTRCMLVSEHGRLWGVKIRGVNKDALVYIPAKALVNSE